MHFINGYLKFWNQEQRNARIIQLLIKFRNGSKELYNPLFPRVYEPLKHVASGQLASEDSGHTYSKTGLVHGAYVRLINQDEMNWQNRGLTAYEQGEVNRAIEFLTTARPERLPYRPAGKKIKQSLSGHNPETLQPQWQSAFHLIQYRCGQDEKKSRQSAE